MMDIHKGQTIYLEDPKLYLPKRKSHRGRTLTRWKTDQLGLEVGQWAEQQLQPAWEKIVARHSSQGYIISRVVHRKIKLWDGEKRQAHK